MTDNKVTLEIDGREVKAEAGSMLIEVADAEGIHIPRFCYHRKLSVSANCRMCMVDIEKAPKPMPACATPIADGMKVRTRSAKAMAAQKSAMEFLLINHPLDCPICDQGGECELQDVAVGYGSDVSQYTEAKRVVQDKDIGPLIETELTRCIHCTRCVRFGEEIAGVRELGATGRGEFMQIGTYIAKSVTSELSGNVIDLCPVGALTAKPSRYQSRPWELTQHATIATHDALGSNIFMHTRNGRVIRNVPRENEAVNESWISDRDRFSYQALDSESRVTEPMVRENGQWKTVGWETALEFTSKKLLSIDPTDVLAMLSPNSSTEELYLAQKYLRRLGVTDIDHRLKESDFSDQEKLPLFPWLGSAVADVEKRESVLLVGSNLRKDIPLLAHRLHQASKSGAVISVINPVDFDFYFPVKNQLIVDATGMIESLAAVAKAAFIKNGNEVPKAFLDLLDNVRVDEITRDIAESLSKQGSTTILLGAIATYHSEASVIRALAQLICAETGARLGFLPTAANCAGAWISGAVPHRKPEGALADKVGRSLAQRGDELPKAIFLLNTEVEADCGNALAASQALLKAEFVVALSVFESDLLKTAADVILPIASSYETSGTYVSAEGRWQSVRAALKPSGSVRPAWKVLRVLANLGDQPGFDYNSSEEVLTELKGLFSGQQELSNSVGYRDEYQMPAPSKDLTRMSGDSIYAVDSLVRRSQALQATEDGNADVVIMGPTLASEKDIASGDQVELATNGRQSSFTAKVLDGVAPGLVYTTMGGEASGRLGGASGPVEVSKAGGDL